ncbi:DUF883 domain-containing protein [Legionella rowbothamii]|uniref:DUF883 domain-containing protein n=1 Tax=Legionella rowbothamii TaxID=96229 RepID=UPI00105601FC|nr:DUF883 domain-containing protein [Legionella rowbothamii]
MSNFNQMSEDAKNKYNQLYNEGRKKVESLDHQLTEGVVKDKIKNLEDSVFEYTEEVLNKVKEKPLTSMLIAGGIGYLLSHLLKK